NTEEALRQLATIYIQKGNVKMALECYDRILQLDALAADIYFRKAHLLLKQDEIAEALRNYRKAVSLSPANTQYSIKLAQIYSSRGANSHAVEILSDLLRFAPSCSKAWAEQARMYESLGEYENASYSWRKVLEINKKNPIAIQALLRLSSDSFKTNRSN
ncbi:tetratricopeptide repeat protein, partial [Acidobacteriota bacterium]